MTQLFLVRHGESGWNREGLVQGQSPDAPGLTATGWAQAAEAAARLTGTAATLVLTSDLRRAAETAAVIARRLGVPVRTEPQLRERACGAAEGRPAGGTGLAERRPADDAGAAEGRRTDGAGGAELGFTGTTVTNADAAPPGGESLRQLYERVTGLLAALLTEPADRRIVLVTHGGPVRVTQAWLARLGPAHMPWPEVLNCAVLPLSSAPPVLASAPPVPAPPVPAPPVPAPPVLASAPRALSTQTPLAASLTYTASASPVAPSSRVLRDGSVGSFL